MKEITLAKFLSRSLNLKGEELSNITHEDVKVLFPALQRVSFEYAKKNNDLVETGKIMYVNDGKHTIPYLVPKMSDKMEEFLEFDCKRDKKVEIDYEQYDYSAMSNYQLKCLLNLKFNSREASRKARKELNKRGVILTKKYQRCKEKREYEEEV